MVHIINNPTSERSLLSLCLNDADLLVEVENNEVFSQHFTIPAHRHIFTAMMYLYSKGSKPSPLSIMEVITDKKAKEDIESFGGLGYLEDISLMNIDRSNLKIFCDKIKQTYARKELYDVCENAKNFMLSDESEKLNPSELVGKIENRITEIANSAINETSVSGSGFTSWYNTQSIFVSSVGPFFDRGGCFDKNEISNNISFARANGVGNYFDGFRCVLI